MPAVRVLPDSVINLISAGEVVERPASVVKELVENSLDSGAENISVELEQGGRKSITVRDDGAGMNRHDLLLSVQRHATSKITSSRDLESLGSLGFRGEALPSIAAVTHFTLLTSDGSDAWKLSMDGGELRDVSPASRTRGTTVTAGGLFYNQPARRRFLRKQATELSWVERYLTGCSLSRPDVAFRLSHNGRELFHLDRGLDIPGRLRQRYGLSSGTRHVSGSARQEGYSVSLVWFPESRWSRRTHQYVLVNGRLIYSGQVASVLDRALAGPAGYPLVCCRLTVPGREVDVNVHPAKREVRFREPSAVRFVVEAALGELMESRRSVTRLGARSTGSGWNSQKDIGASTASLFPLAMELQQPFPVHSTGQTGEDLPVVQIGKAYLVTTTETGIALIDQHAAHERILYETVLRTMSTGSGSGGIQRLLLPETAEMDGSEIDLIQRYREVIERSGFEFHMEESRLILTGVPSGVFHGAGALREILASLSDEQRDDIPMRERIAAATACAGAVKFGDRLSASEARHLVDQLFSTSDPFHCPHGRPTLIEISYDELEEKFGR